MSGVPWVRKRCYNKVHVKSWTIFLEKDGYVKCFFQNCKFMAFDVDEMAKHYSLCGGGGCPDAKYVCPSCDGCTVSYKKLQLHMARAHNITSTADQTISDSDLERSDGTVTTVIEKQPISKVVIMSWRCSFEQNKFIKCSHCNTLVADVEYLIRHYPECKKVPLSACYVCQYCMGRAVDINFLAYHMIYAHEKSIDFSKYNEITSYMVRFWEDEMEHKKFAYCLHKSNGENDCLFFEMDITNLIFHAQHCQAIKPPDRHVCLYCGCWTTTLEKLQRHIEECHTDPLGALIFTSEKKVSSDSSDLVTIPEDEFKESTQLYKKENIYLKPNTGYNLFDEFADVERDGYCEEKEPEMSVQEECRRVKSYEICKEDDSRDNKIFNSSSFCTPPEVGLLNLQEGESATEMVTCNEDNKFTSMYHEKKHFSDSEDEHLLPTDTFSNFDKKFKKGLNLILDGNSCSSSETFGEKQNNDKEEVELIIPDFSTKESDVDSSGSVVSKLSIMNKDGTFQVIPQGMQNEISKSGNDIFHLKDGCVVEITLCGGNTTLASSITTVVPETNKLAAGTDKEQTGTQINCLNGNVEIIDLDSDENQVGASNVNISSQMIDSDCNELIQTNNNFKDEKVTNTCDKSIYVLEKTNVANNNSIKINNDYVTQEISIRNPKHLSTSPVFISDKPNLFRDSFESPVESDQDLKPAEPIDYPETSIKDVNLSFSNLAFHPLNSLTDTEGLSEEDNTCETDLLQENKNIIITSKKSNEVSEHNKDKSFTLNKVLHGENSVDCQRIGPEVKVESETQIIYSNSLTKNKLGVDNELQNKLNIDNGLLRDNTSRINENSGNNLNVPATETKELIKEKLNVNNETKFSSNQLLCETIKLPQNNINFKIKEVSSEELDQAHQSVELSKAKCTNKEEEKKHTGTTNNKNFNDENNKVSTETLTVKNANVVSVINVNNKKNTREKEMCLTANNPQGSLVSKDMVSLRKLKNDDPISAEFIKDQRQLDAKMVQNMEDVTPESEINILPSVSKQENSLHIIENQFAITVNEGDNIVTEQSINCVSGESNISEDVRVPKRKRGRPPKVLSKANTTETQNLVQSENNLFGTASSMPNTKIKPCSSEEVLNEHSHTETSEVNQSLATTEGETALNKIPDCTVETEHPSSTKKKRGRPRKRKLEPTDNVDDISVNMKKSLDTNISDINIIVTKQSLDDQIFTECSETCDSDKHKSEMSLIKNNSGIINSIEQFKIGCSKKKKGRPSKIHQSEINPVESDATASSLKVDLNISTLSVKEPLSSCEGTIIGHQLSDVNLQPETSDTVSPLKMQKKRGRKSKKDKLIELDSVALNSNINLPLLDGKTRSSERVKQKEMEVVTCDGADNKWYLQPDNSTKRKRSRPGKTNDDKFVYFMDSDQDTAVGTCNQVMEEDPPKPKKIDRRLKCYRTLKINKTDDIQPSIHMEDSSMVKCGRCGEEMSKLIYQTTHEIKHNYLCWLEGEEPIDFSNESAVVSILNNRRKNKKLVYKCEECGIGKRSAVGFLSHIQFCGKSLEEREAMMVRCEICGRIMMPASLKVHMGQAHNPKKPVPEEEKPTFVMGKRAAASKAELTFQDNNGEDGDADNTAARSCSPDEDSVRRFYIQPFTRISNGQIAIWKKRIKENGFGACYSPGCPYVGTTVKLLQDHLKECTFKPTKIYSCRNCHYSTDIENDIVKHIKEIHTELLNEENFESSSSDSATESGQSPNISKKIYPKLKFIREIARHQRRAFLHQALTWTYNKRLKLQSTTELNDFCYKASDWVSLGAELAESYLPSTKTSIQIRCNNEEWEQLELFQGTILDGTPAMFVGGPVWACSWTPVPNTETNQYLAVACHPDMDAEHAMGCTYAYKNIIQIWDFGCLYNIADSPVEVPPSLLFAIAHNHGAVWALEWCVSNCFSSSQLGLLAAACSDGSVMIYSIPRHPPSESHNVYKVKPVVVLKLGCEMVTQCTRVTWQKVSPHNILAGGFANGMVALWDLNTTSTLLRVGECIFPYCVFQAHNSTITGISFSPSEETRYMSTSSTDRANKFWDLQDITAPISVNRKGAVTDSTWLPHWLCSVNIYDDIYGYGNTSVSLFSYRDFFFQPYPVAPQTAVNWSLTHCEWLNSICICDEFGRVNVSFLLQLIHMDDKKGRRCTQNIISTSIHDFGEETSSACNSVDPNTVKAKQKESSKKNTLFLDKTFETNLKKYGEMASRFGLAFSIDKTTARLNLPKKEISAINYLNYPLSSVNKVSWNPNYKSFLWIAAGFQSGLILAPRVPYVRKQDLVTFYKKNET